MAFVIVAKPSGAWGAVVVESRYSDLQRGGYATNTPAVATKIGTRGAKTALSGGWTLLDKPARGYAFEDDGEYYWKDDNGYNWIREDEWATIAKPTG